MFYTYNGYNNPLIGKIIMYKVWILYREVVLNPRKTKSFYIGRFSDLFHLCDLPGKYQWYVVNINSYTGIYSSGSVQDFHLIPFSLLLRGIRISNTNNLYTNMKQNTGIIVRKV